MVELSHGGLLVRGDSHGEEREQRGGGRARGEKQPPRDEPHLSSLDLWTLPILLMVGGGVGPLLLLLALTKYHKLLSSSSPPPGHRKAADNYIRLVLLPEHERNKRTRKRLARGNSQKIKSIYSALLTTGIPGPQALQYAERLVQSGLTAVPDLAHISTYLFNDLEISSSHRRKIVVCGQLSQAEESPVQSARLEVERVDARDDPAQFGDSDPSTSVLIPDRYAGSRMDAALAALHPSLSRTYFGSLCSEGRVEMNGQIVKKSDVVPSHGILVDVRLRPTRDLQVVPERIPLSVLSEDAHVLAVNKPAGLVVHPGAGNWNGTLANALVYHVRKAQASSETLELLPDSSESGLRPGIVHRLDRGTSGVLLAVKSESALRALSLAFAERRVWKCYIAVCIGEFPSEKKLVHFSGPIGRHPIDRIKMAVRPDGKAAYSIVSRLATNGRLSLVVVLLRTGRTHQIRVHLQHAGHPILGDELYGDPNWNSREQRHATRPLLHALQIRYRHPEVDSIECVTAPPPADIVRYGTLLSGYEQECNFQSWLMERVDDSVGKLLEKFEF